MNAKEKTFQLMSEVSGSIFLLGRDVVMPLFEKHFTEQRFYAPTFMASNVSPKPISVELLSKRTPYGNPESYKKTLNDAAEAGYLEADGLGGYVVAEKGAKAIKESHTAFYGHINKVSQFPADKMAELTELLRKLVRSSAQVDFKTGRVAFDISHKGHPKVDAGSLAEVDQRLDDMRAFRDDAHIAAWTPTGINGQLWETLTFVWDGEENTADKLAERLIYRGYTTEDYAKALDELQELGWVESRDDGFSVTLVGKKVREDGEATTNRLYFAPWDILSESELARLGELLAELKEANEKLLPASE